MSPRPVSARPRSFLPSAAAISGLICFRYGNDNVPGRLASFSASATESSFANPVITSLPGSLAMISAASGETEVTECSQSVFA